VSGTPRLTYCGNVHRARDLAEWLEATERYGVPVGRQRAARGGAFGLGVWWGAELAHVLATDADARGRVRDALDAWGLELWTANVFPFGDFHASEVKTAVYTPDWASEERLQYTREVAEVLAELAPPGAVVPLSTLPLGYASDDQRRMARNLVRAASHLHDLRQRTGRELVLALEPEPFCLLETAAAAMDFLQDRVFGAPGAPLPEAELRRHLGVCVDLCHLAVVGEDPAAAFADLDRCGIRVPKVQVSACLEVRDPERGLDRLLEFDEARYLHQTVSVDGALRALDLGEVRERRAEFARAARLRTHFHVPVFWDEPGPVGSTRKELERVLPALARRADRPVFEVETYTWSVLGNAWRPDRDLTHGLLAELEFTGELLRTDEPTAPCVSSPHR
jgi:sugar phosphate isomerase/epimerase